MEYNKVRLYQIIYVTAYKIYYDTLKRVGPLQQATIALWSARFYTTTLLRKSVLNGYAANRFVFCTVRE